jgi:hypothetical protein
MGAERVLLTARLTYLDSKSHLYLYAHNSGGFDSYIIAFWFLKLDIYRMYNKNLTLKKKNPNIYL